LFQLEFFFNFWSLKPWIRIGLQPQTLDPDPDQMNTDPAPALDPALFVSDFQDANQK
jgi:hypothetical protein